MSNVISFCDYRQKKLEDKIEQEWNAWDSMILNNLTTSTFTVTIDDKPFTITIDDDYKPK